MGQSVLFTILPPVSREIGLSEIELGIIFSVSAALSAIATPIWGRLSDRVGRKMIFSVSLAGFGFFTLIFALALHGGISGYYHGAAAFYVLLVIRMFHGVVGGAAPPVATAFVADVSPAEERTKYMALVGVGLGLGILLGPALGGVLVALGVLVPLYVFAFLCPVYAAIVSKVLPQSTGRLEELPTRLRLWDVRIAPAFAAAFLNTIAIAATQNTIAFLLQDVLKLSTAETIRTVAIALVVMAMSAVAAQLGVVGRFKPKFQTLLSTGYPLLLVSFLVIYASDGFTGIISGLMLLGFSQGLIQPGLPAAVSSEFESDQQGNAMGLLESSGPAGYVVGPVLGTWLYGYGSEYTYLTNALLIVACLPFVLFILTHHRRVAQTDDA